MRIRIAAIAGLLFYCSLVPAVSATRFDPASVITPPAGWYRETLKGSRSAALGYVLAQWYTDARGHEEFIEIGSHPSFGFTDESFGVFYQASLKRFGATISAYREQPLCRGERGWYVRHRDFEQYGGDNVEDVYVLDGNKVYFASYHYPGSYTAAAPARHAILSLCIPHPVAVRRIILPFKFVAPQGWLLSDPRRMGLPAYPGAIGTYVNVHGFKEAIQLSQERLDDAASAGNDSSGSDTASKALAKEQKGLRDLSQPVFQLQRLCENHVGWLATYNEKYEGKNIIVEEMILPGPVTYSAAYGRLASQRESPEARAALKTICPLSSNPS